VISHAVHLSEQGHRVITLIDDQEGQRLASSWGPTSTFSSPACTARCGFPAWPFLSPP
jgi:hypothetical protein